MTEQLKALALAAHIHPSYWHEAVTLVCEDGFAQADAAYIAAASPDVVLWLIAERDELKRAYAECSRQKNELLTAHKVNARKEVEDEALMRECLESLTRFNAGSHCIAFVKLTARLGSK